MALIKCSECGKEISDKAVNCPNCGAPVENGASVEARSGDYTPSQKITWNQKESESEARQNVIGNNGYSQNQQTFTPYKAKTKVSGQTSRLVIGIISCCLFPIIALQSCAAGVANALSDTNEVSGTFGLLFGIFMLVSGIISIVMRKKDSKISYILPICFYTIGALFSAVGAGSYSDLFIWCSLGILFSSIILFNYLNNIETSKVVSIAVPIVFFIIFVSTINLFKPSEEETTFTNKEANSIDDNDDSMIKQESNTEETEKEIEEESESIQEEEKIYSMGETWTVDGQWNVTVNSVEETTDRNEYSDKDPAAVYLVTYTYENIGYVDRIGLMDGLFLGMEDTIVDSTGKMGYSYPGNKTLYAQETPVGATCEAQACIGVDNAGSFKIHITHYDGNGDRQSAIFNIDL